MKGETQQNSWRRHLLQQKPMLSRSISSPKATSPKVKTLRAGETPLCLLALIFSGPPYFKRKKKRRENKALLLI